MKISRSSLGLALRAIREAARMTLKDLSASTGIAVSSLSRSENGQRDLEFAEVVQVCETVGLDVLAFRMLAESIEEAGSSDIARKGDELKSELLALQQSALEAAVEVSALKLKAA